MNAPSNTMADVSPDPQAAPMVLSATRPFYWSVRRELWENRSVYMAPLVVAAIVLAGFLISTIHLPAEMSALLAQDPAQRNASIGKSYDIAAVALIVTCIIVGAVYCFGALYNERRDRSILFWKSLPVSDLTVVLSKAAIPLAVLPLIGFVVTFVTQLIMLLISTAVLVTHGVPAAPLWLQVARPERWFTLAYGLATLALWYAPLYGWLLLVSGWARRTPFLWAILPPLGLCLIEKIAFGTSYFGSLLIGRLSGGFSQAFAMLPPDTDVLHQVVQPDPLKFMSSFGLWLGLMCAMIFLGLAVRQRRSREPI